MSEVEIRLVTLDDFDAYWALRLRALKEEPESFGSSYEEAAKRPRADIEKMIVSSNGSFVLGAFAPHLVGVVGMFRAHGAKEKHKGGIWGMYVAPEFRGRGFGRQLMTAAIAQARTVEEVEELRLAVVTTNDAAYKLYLSLGFTEYGVEPRALKLGDKYLDEHMMVLRLPEH